MTIKVYAHWADQEIRTDLDRDNWIDDQAKAYYEDPYELDKFLNDLATDFRNPFSYLFKLSENEKQEIMDNFKAQCKEIATDDFNEEHEEFEFKI